MGWWRRKGGGKGESGWVGSLTSFFSGGGQARPAANERRAQSPLYSAYPLNPAPHLMDGYSSDVSDGGSDGADRRRTSSRARAQKLAEQFGSPLPRTASAARTAHPSSATARVARRVDRAASRKDRQKSRSEARAFKV
jgi:hypothetical protein